MDMTRPGLATTPAATRSWRLTEVGNDLSATLAFTYLNEDVVGDESTFKLYRRSGGMNQEILSSLSTATNTITTLSPISDFSDWGIGVDAATGASVDVGGRVRQANGRGVFRARVTLTDVEGNVRVAYTNPFGYYRFTDVAVGETYVFQASHIRYQFAQPTFVQVIDEETVDINFTVLNFADAAKPNAPEKTEGKQRTIESKRP